MAEFIKITELPDLPNQPDSNDPLVVVDLSDTSGAVSGTTKKIIYSNLLGPILSATTASFTIADETKLDGIATGATANSPDAFLLDRANHTGTQTASTISDFDTQVSANADVVANTAKVSADGSVTTHNDVTSAGSGQIITGAERTKLDGIETGATANSPDAFLLDRTNHTGTQAISTVTGLQTELDAKAENLGDLGVTASATELNFSTGVTSSIQTQINNKPDNLGDLGDVNLTGLTTNDTIVYDGVEFVRTPLAGGGGEVNTASNIGSGSGVFAQKVGVDLELRSLLAASNKVTITQGANEVTFDVNEANLTTVLKIANNLSDLGDAGTARANLDIDQKAVTFGSVTPDNDTIYVTVSAPYPFTINSIQNLQTSSGTINVTVNINGTPVTGLNAVGASSTSMDYTATAANSVLEGDEVSIVFSANSSSADLRGTILITQ